MVALAVASGFQGQGHHEERHVIDQNQERPPRFTSEGSTKSNVDRWSTLLREQGSVDLIREHRMSNMRSLGRVQRIFLVAVSFFFLVNCTTSQEMPQLNQDRVDVLGWTDAHTAIYGLPISGHIIPEEDLKAFLATSSGSDFLCRQNDFGQTLLHLSVRQNRSLGLLWFLLYDRDMRTCIDVANKDGDTALHYAIAWDRPEHARILLQAGADRKLENHLGESPLDDARKKNDEWFHLLQSFKKDEMGIK